MTDVHYILSVIKDGFGPGKGSSDRGRQPVGKVFLSGYKRGKPRHLINSKESIAGYNEDVNVRAMLVGQSTGWNGKDLVRACHLLI